MRKIFSATLVVLLVSTLSFAQGQSGGRGNGRGDDHDDGGPIQVGYAIVTPTSSATSGLVVFATFGFNRGGETTQAGILPSDLAKEAAMFVNTHGELSRNLGIGITNPNSSGPAMVTFTLRKEDGTAAGTSAPISIPAGQQTAKFITDIFSSRSDVPRDLTGTVRITSDVPVGLVGLRFRGANFSTIPITNLSPTTTVPSRGTGIGGAGAVLLPHFAADGGWATELVLVNTGAQALTVRADFFKQDGTAMTVRLNGESKSSFTNLSIPAGGVLQLAPKDNRGHSRF